MTGRIETRLKALEQVTKPEYFYCIFEDWTPSSTPAEQVLVRAWTGTPGEMEQMSLAEFRERFPGRMEIHTYYDETSGTHIKVTHDRQD